MSKRIWLIGTGPSLRIDDLEKLRMAGEYCIAVNRIHVWYDKMKWRPNVWVCDDSWKAVDWDGDFMFHANQGYEVWVRDTMLYDFTERVKIDPKLNTTPGEYANPRDPIKMMEMIDRHKKDAMEKQHWWDMPNLHIFHDCLHQVEYKGEAPPPWHLPYPCSYGWSVYIAAQLAVLKGAECLVFLGCDGYYPEDGSPTHMDPQYIMRHHIDTGEVVEWPQDWGYRNENLARGHEKIQEECDLRQISVINASRETHITAHERKTLEEVIRHGC